MLVLACVVKAHPVPCETLRVTTLAFSRPNTQELARLLDFRLLGGLTLLCSDFLAKSPTTAVGRGMRKAPPRGPIP
jgi:hypothetical protein